MSRPGAQAVRGTLFIVARTQCFNDLAILHSAVPTTSDDPSQFPAHRSQVGNLALHLGEVPVRNCIYRSAGLAAIVGEREQVAHGIETETEIAGAANE